jgi:hypothetical protein
LRSGQRRRFCGIAPTRRRLESIEYSSPARLSRVQKETSSHLSGFGFVTPEAESEADACTWVSTKYENRCPADWSAAAPSTTADVRAHFPTRRGRAGTPGGGPPAFNLVSADFAGSFTSAVMPQ